MTASGSSALACSTGAPTVLATSVGWGLDRPSQGVVVKPTWLFTTRWTVPLVVNPALAGSRPLGRAQTVLHFAHACKAARVEAPLRQVLHVS